MMETPTAELMELIDKITSEDIDAEEAFSDLSRDDLEQIEVFISEADGTLRGIEPFDYTRWRR